MTHSHVLLMTHSHVSQMRMCNVTHKYEFPSLGHIRVVPSRIPNLERKRGQYQVFGFVRAKRQRNVASKSRNLRNVWKEPCTGCGFVTFVTFLRFSDILGFAKKKKKYILCDKNLEMSQRSQV